MSISSTDDGSPAAEPGEEQDHAEASAPCPRCGKVQALCVCADIEPIKNRIGLLILQHPQEQDLALGTAKLTALHFTNAVLRVGLSWPSLAAALGRPAAARRWGILYLGSSKAAEIAPAREIVALDRHGDALPDQKAALADLEGIVALDGTWSQAKALWWRNAWMLKSPRLILGPQHPSRYGALRREPRQDGLSTLEAVGLLLSRLEGKPEIEAKLADSFERLLARYRQTSAGAGRRRSARAGRRAGRGKRIP